MSFARRRNSSNVVTLADTEAFMRFRAANLRADGKADRLDTVVGHRLIEACLERHRGRITAAVDANASLIAAIFCCWDRSASFYLVSTRRSDAGNGAISLLIWEAIQEAAAKGLHFDMEGIGNAGSVSLYSGFGGKLSPRYIAARRVEFGAFHPRFSRRSGGEPLRVSRSRGWCDAPATRHCFTVAGNFADGLPIVHKIRLLWRGCRTHAAATTERRVRCWKRFGVGLAASLAASLAGSCAPVSYSPPPATLSQTWMIGIERMRNDPVLLAPNTNRFLAVLAAMPQVQVVFVGADRNDQMFSAYTGNKLRVYSALRTDNACMEFSTSVFRAGQQVVTYGLVVPPLPAGPEPDSACVDRAAASFYQSMVSEGL